MARRSAGMLWRQSQIPLMMMMMLKATVAFGVAFAGALMLRPFLTLL